MLVARDGNSRVSPRRSGLAIRRAPSLGLALALLGLMALQFLSFSGPLLQSLGAETAAGWLVDAMLVALLIDAARGAVPRVTALVPVIVFASYSAAAWMQREHLRLASMEFQTSNPARALPFDPRTDSLVIDDAGTFAATHAIPVVYARDTSYLKAGYAAYRLMTKERLRQFLARNADDVQVFSVHWAEKSASGVKVVRLPEAPTGRVIEAETHDYAGAGWADWNIGYETTSIKVDGRVAARYKSGHVRKLPLFPFLKLGCSFTAQERTCAAEFATETLPIESRPAGVEREFYADPVSIMLGVSRLSYEEIRKVQGYGDLDAPPRAAPGEDEAFGALADILAGRSPAISWKTSFLIASRPGRLAPVAAAMSQRFLELRQSDENVSPGRLQQIHVLEAGLEALGLAEFAAVRDGLSLAVQGDATVREAFPRLYLRLADKGSDMYSIYRDRLLAPGATPRDKLLSVLAMCRLGEADSEVVASLAAELDKPTSGEAKDENYRSAIFVTLLKLGRDEALRSFGKASARDVQAWYDAIRAGAGKTDVGPNNCMPIDWPEALSAPAILAPGLKWVRGRWAPFVADALPQP